MDFSKIILSTSLLHLIINVIFTLIFSFQEIEKKTDEDTKENDYNFFSKLLFYFVIVNIFSEIVVYYAKINSCCYNNLNYLRTHDFSHPNDSFIFIPIILTIILNEFFFFVFNFSPEKKYIIFSLEKYYYLVIQIAKLFVSYYQFASLDVFLIFLQNAVEYTILNIGLKHKYSNFSGTTYIFSYLTEIYVILSCIEFLYDLYRYDYLTIIYKGFEDRNNTNNIINNQNINVNVNNNTDDIKVKFTKFTLLYTYDDLKRLIGLFLFSILITIVVQGIFSKFMFYHFVTMILEIYLFLVSLYKDKFILSFSILVALFIHVSYYKIVLFEYTL